MRDVPSCHGSFKVDGAAVPLAARLRRARSVTFGPPVPGWRIAPRSGAGTQRSNAMSNRIVEECIRLAREENPEFTDGDAIEMRSVFETMPEFAQQASDDDQT